MCDIYKTEMANKNKTEKNIEMNQKLNRNHSEVKRKQSEIHDII